MAESYLDILADTIRKNWNQPALTDFYLTEDGISQDTSRGNHYTYGEMYAEICRVAELLTNFGLQKGDHIAICGANSSHWVIAYLAIAKIQGVSVTVMHSLQPDQIAQMVDFSDAKALFTNKELWVELQGQSLSQVQSIIALETWEILRGKKVEILNRKSLIDNQECGFPQSAPDDLAMICFTSGTTSKPKGVALLQKNISASIGCVSAVYKVSDNLNMFLNLPLGHLVSVIGELLTPLVQGCCIYINKGNYSIDFYIQSVELIKPFEIVCVPLILKKLFSTQYVKRVHGFNSFLEYLVVGCAVVSNELEKTAQKLHLPITIGYGMTETCALIAQIPPQQFMANSCGKVCETLTTRISPAGEILVKGENVMLGYYKDPEATARKIDADGWLHTGDKGHLDEDGYLYVEGRLEQDMIVLPNGENIRPDNIESLINALPEVSESIVFARDGKLVAIAVLSSPSLQGRDRVRLSILRAVNPQLPLFSQLYDVEITDVPLQRTEKQTLKRYLYK